jgi:hypothetical protein
MHTTPKQWIHANRTALTTLAEYVNAMPNPWDVYGGIPAKECIATIEPYNPEYHADVEGLIITETCVTHVGQVHFRGIDVLLSVRFNTLSGLVLMYINLSRCFWNLMEPGIAVELEAMQSTIAEVNRYPLAKMGLKEAFRQHAWSTFTTSVLPEHLQHVQLDTTVVTARTLDGTLFGLEIANVKTDGDEYVVTTLTGHTKKGIAEMMAIILETVNGKSQQPAERVTTVPTPRPDPMIDAAMLAIVKSIEHGLQVDLGRAEYTVVLDLKKPLKRTMTISAPDTSTLNKAANSVYSTCVKIGKDYKRGCSVTVSHFACSVIVTITPTDRVIHL